MGVLDHKICLIGVSTLIGAKYFGTKTGFIFDGSVIVPLSSSKPD